MTDARILTLNRPPSDKPDDWLVELDSATLAKMSKRGELGLPPLLDQRRLKFGITDKAFQGTCVFDRVVVFQIPMIQGDTFEGSKILMPDTTKSREMNGAPRGIIVSAGALALDSLRSNGVDLGHIILFVNAAPYHVRYDTVGGKAKHLIVLTAGDVIQSEDLTDALRSGKVKIVPVTSDDGVTTHTYIDEAGKTWLPQSAWQADS